MTFIVGGVTAQAQKENGTDKATQKEKTAGKGEKKETEAKITKVDAKKGTVTVHMKDKNGKDMDRTFTLTEDVRMLDSAGRVVAFDVFRSGDEVLVIEQEGRLKELHKHKNKNKGGAKEK